MYEVCCDKCKRTHTVSKHFLTAYKSSSCPWCTAMCDTSTAKFDMRIREQFWKQNGRSQRFGG